MRAHAGVRTSERNQARMRVSMCARACVRTCVRIRETDEHLQQIGPREILPSFTLPNSLQQHVHLVTSQCAHITKIRQIKIFLSNQSSARLSSLAHPPPQTCPLISGKKPSDYEYPTRIALVLLICMCALTRSFACYHSFECVLVPLHRCALPHAGVWRTSFTCVWRTSFTCVRCQSITCALADSCVCHVSLIHVPRLIHICAMPHTCMCHDSLIYVP